MMYPLGLEADHAACEHAARLERAQRAALLAEARRALRNASVSAPASPLLMRRQRFAARWLRTASAWLAALADSLDTPMPVVGRR